MMPPLGTPFDPWRDLVGALGIFAANHPDEELTLTETDIRRITGMGNAIRPALREAGWLNPRPGIWVRPA